MKAPDDLSTIDAGKIIERYRRMQDSLSEGVSDLRIEASSGDGMVTVCVDGNMLIQSVKISPEAVKDVNTLQDLLQEAITEALQRADVEAQNTVNSVLNGMFGTNVMSKEPRD